MLALGWRVRSLVVVVVVSVVVVQPASARSAAHPMTAIALFIEPLLLEAPRAFDLFLTDAGSDSGLRQNYAFEALSWTLLHSVLNTAICSLLRIVSAYF